MKNLTLFILLFLSVSCQSSITEKLKVLTGVDMNQITRSCSPLPANTPCTMLFGPSDKFAADCENSGNVAVACACHDYICVKKSFR